MAGGNNVKVSITGSESVSAAALKAAAAIEALKDKKVTIEVDIDKDKALKSIKDINKEAQDLGKDIGDFDLDTKKARDKLNHLHNRAKELGTLDAQIDLSTSSADGKLDRLLEKKEGLSKAHRIELDAGPANSKLDRLLDKKTKFEKESTRIELDAGPANSKLDRLHDKKNKFSEGVTLNIDVDSANGKLNRLAQKHGNFGEPVKIEIDTEDARAQYKQLANDSKKIKIKIDTDKAMSKVAALATAIDALSGRSIDIDVDIDDAIAKATALKGVLDSLGDENVNIGTSFDDSNIGRLKRELDDLLGQRNILQANLDRKALQDDIDAVANKGIISEDDAARLKEMRADLKSMRAERVDFAEGTKGRDELEYDIAFAEKGIKAFQKKIKESSGTARVNVDVDGIEKIEAIDVAIAAVRKKIEVEVDVDQNALDSARTAGRSRTINIDVESRGIPELLRNVEYINAIADKTVVVRFKVKGLAELSQAETAMRAIRSKDVDVNINTNSKDVGKLTGKGKDSLGESVTKQVKIDTDFTSIDKANEKLRKALKDAEQLRQSRGQSFYDAELNNATEQLNNYRRALRNVANDSKIASKDFGDQEIRFKFNDAEINRYQSQIDKLKQDRPVITAEFDSKKLIQLTKMRQELERLETLEKSRSRLKLPNTGENGIVESANARRKLRKDIADMERDFNRQPIEMLAEIKINERRLRDLEQKLASRKTQLGEPVRVVDTSNEALKNLKSNLKDTNIKIRAIMDRDNAINDLKKQKADIEKTPVKLRTQADNTALKNINKDLKNLQNVKRQAINLDVRLADRNRLQQDIKAIKSIRTNANNNQAQIARVKVEAETTEAAAKLAALTRPRDTTLRVNVNESRIQRVTRIFNDIGNSATDAGRRISRAFNDDNSGMSSTLRNVSRLSNGINRGIGAMTSRIPLVGGLFKGMAALGDVAGGVTTKMASLAGAGPKLAGAFGGVANAVVSAASAFVGLGIIGVVGTGAITAGAYAATAALGTIAGIAGAVGAAIGGAFIGGFAYLVKDVPAVKEAYSQLGESVSSTMKQLATPVAIPIANAAPKLQAAFDQVTPSISRIASQTGALVNELGDKLPAVAAQVGPALQKAFDFGDSSLNSLMDNMPAITKGIGEFFGKLDSPEVNKAVNSAFAALPGIISGIGTGIEKAAAGFNNMQEFMSSDKLDPMREGFEKFRDSLSGTDWSSASDGFTNAMNSFGTFAGNFDMQNISDGIGGIANAFANLTDVADSMNLDGIFAGLGKAADVGTKFLPRLAEAFGLGGSALTEPFKDAWSGINNFIDDTFGGPPTSVDGPAIELNPTITVKEQENADVAKRILGNIDGKSFGSADAAERIISNLENDISNVEVNPKIKGIIDDVNGLGIDESAIAGSLGKNINSANLGNVLANAFKNDRPLEIPMQVAADIENAAGDDGLGVLDTIKDQFSRLTGMDFDEINIKLPVSTQYDIVDRGENIGDIMRTAIDSQGNLTQTVVMEAEVVSRVSKITGLTGLNLDAVLGSALGDETISAEVAVQIKAAMGLADVSMGEFESALESNLKTATGTDYDVKINANGSVTIDKITPPEIPDIPMPEGDLPPVTWQQEIEVASTFNYDAGDVDVAREELRSLGLEGGESIEITQEMMIELEAIVGGGSEAEVQGKIKQLLAQFTGLSPEEIDVLFNVNAKPTVGDGPAGIMGSIGSELKNKFGAALGKGTEVDAPVTVNPQVTIGKMGVENVGAALRDKQVFKTDAAVQTQQMKVQLVPDLSGLAGLLGAGVPMRVILIPDISGLAGLLGAGVPMRVILLPDFTAIAGLLGAGVPMRVILIPDISGIAGILGMGIPMRVILIPDLSALGALGGIALPPIRVPVIPDLSGIGAIGGISLPPIRIPVVIDIPTMPTFPNTTSTHTVMVIAPPIPPYPSTTSTHTVVMNAPASTPSYPNTSSTHTVNIVVNGSMPSGGGGSTIRAAAMGAVGAMGSAARGISSAMGASVPMSAPSMSGGGRGVAAIYRTGQAISESIGAGLMAGKDSIDKAANEIGQAVGSVGPQVDKYLEANSPEYKEAKRIGFDIANNIGQGITDAQGVIGSAMDGLNKFISDPLGEIDKALSANVPGYDAAKAQLEGFIKGVEDTMSGLEAAAKVGAEGFQKIIAEEFVLPPMDQLEAKAREIGDGIGAALMGDPSKLAGTMDGLGQAMSAKLGTVAGKVNEVMSQINQTMRDKVPGFADAQDQAVAFGQGLVSSVDQARQQMNQQLSSMGLPTIPTPQMAMDGLNAEVAKVKNTIDTGIRGLLVQTPAPVIPAPNLGPVMAALGQIPGVIPTINRVQSDADKVIRDVNNIPEVANTRNVVDTNIDRILSQIGGLKQNTQSRHIVKMTVQGSGAVARAARGSSRGGPMGIARGAMGIGPMGAGASTGGGAAGGQIYNMGKFLSESVAAGIVAGIPAIVNAGNMMTGAALDSFSGNLSSIAFENGKATALGYVDGIMSQYGVATQAGGALGKNVLAGAKFNGIFTNEVGKQVAEIMKFFGNGIGNIIFQAIGAIPFIGPLLQLGGILLGQFAQQAAYNNSPYAKGVSNYYYYHYETTNNSFDGGLVGDPESQARRVLDVLEQSPSTRRIRKVMDQ